MILVIVTSLAIVPMIRGYFTFGLYAFDYSWVLQNYMVPRYVYLETCAGGFVVYMEFP